MILEEYDLVIIGAGISGLSLGKALANSSVNFKIFDKSKGLGGRAATRRVNAQPVDTGAQYFTVTKPEFRVFTENLIERGVVKLWTNKLNIWSGDKLLYETNSCPRYVCPNGMTDLAKELGKVLPVSREVKIIRVERKQDSWILSTDKMFEIKAKRIVSTAPFPQSLELFGGFFTKEQLASFDSISFNPCLSIVINFKKNINLPFKGIFWNHGGTLSWVSNDSSKRINPSHSVIVAQCLPDFSKEYFSKSDSEIVNKVLAELNPLFPQISLSGGEIEEVQVKKWLYSQPTSVYKNSYFVNEDKSLYFTGDWSLEGKIEGAYMAGLSLAKVL